MRNNYLFGITIPALSFILLFMTLNSLQAQTINCPDDIVITAVPNECCATINLSSKTFVSGDAIPDITIYHPSSRMWHNGLAYNPNEQLYYQVPLAGGNNNDISTHDVDGNLVHAVNVGFNYRGLWWNTLINELQGQNWNITNVEVLTVDLDANQYGLGTGTSVVGDTHPYFHVSFDYDYDDDQLVAVWQNTLYKYATDGTFLGSLTLAQAPTSATYNRYIIGYSGIPGAEIIRYDNANQRVIFFDKYSGAYAGEINMPANLGSYDQSLYNLSFANNRVWLYNNQTDTWYGYIIIVDEEFGFEDTDTQTVTQTEGLPVNACFPLGTTTNTYVATDIATGSTASCSFDVTVLEDPQSNIDCDALDDWIEKVTIGDMVNESGNNQGYQSFNLTVNLSADGDHTVTLEPGYGDEDEHVFWRIYVDYNQNGIFEHASEREVQVNGVGPQTKTFNVPPNVLLGQTSLRVTMGVGAYLLPSATNYDGEMEDYLVEINSCVPIVDAGSLTTGNTVFCLGNNSPGIISDNSGITFGDVDYVWVKNETSCVMPNNLGMYDWEVISGEIGATYLPSALSTSTVYSRGVRNQGCQDYTFSPALELTLTDDCLPDCTSTGASTADAYIFRFKLGGINNISGDDGGYGDYSSEQGSITPGQNTSFQLRPKFYNGSQDVHWRVWVDLNQDGIFSDLCEKVIERTAANTQNGIIVIPEGTMSGSAKVRVSMKIGGYPEACESFAEGEVEDYIVTINPSNFNEDIDPIDLFVKEGSQIDDAYANVDFDVLPNPTNGELNFKFKNLDEINKVSIINSLGEVLVSLENVESNLSINMKNFTSSSGVYFINASSKNSTKTKKIFLVD